MKPKKRIAFIGSGEMARHIAHYMVEDNQYDVVGYFDDFTPVGQIVNKYPIIGCLDDIEEKYHQGEFDGLINAIGYTRFSYRKMNYERFIGKIPFETFIHSTCFIDRTAKIGTGVILFPGCIIDRNVIINDNVFMHLGCVIGHDSTIYKHSYLSPSVATAGHVEINEQCNIGISTTISDNIKICAKVRSGAGTVIVKSIVEKGTYVGIPAKKISDKI